MIANQSNRDVYRYLESRYGLVGRSEIFRESVDKLIQAAPTDLTVLITGETGSGKEVFASAIHGLSLRKKFPFVSVNCGAIPENLLESELFGHEKGAFTGAVDQRKGFFETAHKGTIFLDETGEMPLNTQVKLLRVLESGEFTRLGSSQIIKVDVRVIAATNRRLGAEVASGRFRQDLFYRLNSVHIDLPPLRNRADDIEPLAIHFAEKTCEKLNLEFQGISSDSLNILKSLPFPGNVRELRNMIETMITLEKTPFITPEILRKYIPAALPPPLMEDLPREVSMVQVPKRDEHESFELGLIFRTLLEVKNEIADIRFVMNKMLIAMEQLQINTQDLNYQPVSEVSTQIDSIESLEDLHLETIEKRLIVEALKRADGSRRAAAASLGISERTLYRKLQEYGM